MPDRCEPPKEHRHVRFHWLMSWEGYLIVAQWYEPSSRTKVWRFAGRVRQDTPEEAGANGYRYVAPCIPPGASP